MKRTYFIFIISLLLVSSNIQAQDAEYIIQKNDTLWGISGSNLEDPFLWPKLWSVNPHIVNPDLIHPGGRIVIPSREILLQQELPTVDKKLSSVKKLKAPDIKVNSFAAEAIEEKHRKYLIDKNLYISTGWISEDSPAVGKIIAESSGREIAGKGDIVYLNISTKEILSRSGLDDKASLIVFQNKPSKNRFYAIKNIKVVKHPLTGKILGHLIRLAGILEIIGIDNNTPKAKIITSFEDIQVGDGLLPYRDMEPPLVPDIIRTPKAEGYIVESSSTYELSGENNIVFLDKGQNDGLLNGDVFSVFSGSPIEKVIGKIQIISLQPTTSSAVILNSTDEVTIGTKWGYKSL